MRYHTLLTGAFRLALYLGHDVSSFFTLNSSSAVSSPTQAAITRMLPCPLPGLISAQRDVNRKIGQVLFRVPETSQKRIAERLVAVERIGLGSDPDCGVAVAADRIEKRLV